LRYQQKRNFIALLLFSIGVPMLSGGDELGHSQQGNNNAYCQDSEISWYQWELDEQDKKFLQFVKDMIAIRKTHLVIERKQYFKGDPTNSAQEVVWLAVDGKPMSAEDWDNPDNKVLGFLLDGSGIEEINAIDNTVETAKTVLLLANASHLDSVFVLPEVKSGEHWKLLVDTTFDAVQNTKQVEQKLVLKARSVVLFELGNEE